MMVLCPVEQDEQLLSKYVKNTEKHLTCEESVRLQRHTKDLKLILHKKSGLISLDKEGRLETPERKPLNDLLPGRDGTIGDQGGTLETVPT
jgi:hypothetical protein